MEIETRDIELRLDNVEERTITGIELYEFGPVTFPANPNSTAGVRSLTDAYIEGMRSRDPQWVDEQMRAHDPRRTSPAHVTEDAANTPPPAPAESHPGGLTPAQRRERLIQSERK